ncbi:MAG: AAA family ATPase [Deltaproteobacteria bacterium]|nr:AAA family ATPase [Deltaproteobacteria bacterium]
MKIAVTGKGGVGKTTLSALIIRTLNAEGKKVLAIDADPDANLASAIGIANADKITPIAKMKELIFERTGAKAGTIGGFFSLNPKVDDLPDSLSVKLENIKLMKLGGVKKGGGGCICPESTLLKALVMHVVLLRDEFVIMDMEAGIEHLGRATATGVDKLIIVVEPGQRSIDTALNIKQLASEIALKNIVIVGNKIRNKKDEDFLKTRLADFKFLGFIPYDNQLIEADLNSTASYDIDSEAKIKAKEIVDNLIKRG